MKSWEFLVQASSDDPWASLTNLDEDLLESLVKGPIAAHPDVEVAVALARFTHQEFENFGTSGSELRQEQSILLMKALLAVLRRLGISDFALPFRDFDGFYRHWKRVGASGSGGYQKRRDILHELFEPLHQTLAEREAGSITSTLAVAISPHRSTSPGAHWLRTSDFLLLRCRCGPTGPSSRRKSLALPPRAAMRSAARLPGHDVFAH